MARLSLAGEEWQLRGCLGSEWEWHVNPEIPKDRAGWLPARVPGSVLDDVRRAGHAPDPYVERNSLAGEWVAERAWVYRRWFSADVPRDGERAVLRFEGVDHAATVFLDGEAVAHNEGMFRPFRVDVSERLEAGAEHHLAVVVHPPPESEPQIGRTSRVRVHKSRMGYGWDFCPRIVHQGIWRPVTLALAEPLDDVLVSTSLTADLAGGTVEVEAETEGELALTLLAGADAVARAEGTRLGLESPRVWWPNGLGDQHRYRLRIELARDARPAAVRHLDVGFRHVELVPNEGAPPGARPYTFVVNGVRMYVNGWNWVPIDALYGVPRPAKLVHLLELAARARVNLLRVWGGGLIETDEFYEQCDRLGLLVWQEFSQSSSGMESLPSDDPEFVRLMADEARAIVPLRRAHPSLVLWCGGNELAGEDGPLDDSTPVLGALRDVVREVDPDRAWLPTSPSGVPDEHDVHGPWEHQGLTRHNGHYDGGASLLHSEFGVEGMTNRRALAALIAPERRWPPDRTNPVYAHLGAWWNNVPLVEEAFGGPIGDLDTLRRASQHLQHDGLRYAVEANRRRAFRSSGAVPWQLNESYPNAWCTSAIDHRGDPKPAYYGVRRAYEPQHVCASFARWAWGGEEAALATVWAWGGGGEVTARFVDVAGGVATAASWRLPEIGAGPVRAGEIGVALDGLGTDLFLLDLELAGDGVRSRNRYLFSRTADLGPLRTLAPAEVEIEVDAAWRLTLRHAGGPAALGIVLEDARPYEAPGWAVFEDNVLDLLPGEERTVAVAWRDAPGDGRAVLLSGWNVDERRVG
ncbi:MAG: hypothetical protein ICV64_06400 [Thermoleophilia bacterium]|nr:hypothetical protein [Thermoleophilia bacterium]